MSNTINVSKCNAISWIIKRAELVTDEPGYRCCEFKAQIDNRMKAQINSFMKSSGARYVDGRKHSEWNCTIISEGYYTKTMSIRMGERVTVYISENWATEGDKAEMMTPESEYPFDAGMWAAQERYMDAMAAV